MSDNWIGCLKGGEILQDGEEAKSNDLKAAVGNRRTHPLSSNPEGKRMREKLRRMLEKPCLWGQLSQTEKN